MDTAAAPKGLVRRMPHAHSATSLRMPRRVPKRQRKRLLRALRRGDRTTVLDLLAPEATVSTSGQAQPRKSYVAQRLAGDMGFLGHADVSPLCMGSRLMGDTAAVGSEMRVLANNQGETFTLRGKEKLILGKTGSDWSIIAIDWQSTPDPQP